MRDQPYVFMGALVCGSFIIIGLCFMFRKKPLVYSAKYNVLPLTVYFSLMALYSLTRLFSDYADSFTYFLTLFMLVMYVAIVTYLWKISQGYTVLGVSGETFQSALRSALQTLDLPFEESRSGVRLISLKNADLQVDIMSWRGGVNFKFKQTQHNNTLNKIADAMRDYFKASSVQVTRMTSVFFISGGLLFLVFIILVNLLIRP